MAALIIAGDNLQFKSVKKTYGMEGEGFIANIYLNNKKSGYITISQMEAEDTLYLIQWRLKKS